MIHLVKSMTLRRVTTLFRNLEWMLIWKSVPLRRSLRSSWKSIEHWTLHRLLEEIPLEYEEVTKAAELNSIRDKRVVYTEVYKNEADAKIISGK